MDVFGGDPLRQLHGRACSWGRKRKRFLAGVAATSIALAVTDQARADPDDDGLAAFAKHDYTTARQLLVPLADNGDKVAQTALGDIYYDGLGVPKDYAAGVVWFHKAADQGVPVAQFFLGVSYIMSHGSPRDFLEAWVWFTLAAPRFSEADAHLRDQALKLAGVAALRLTPAQIAEGKRIVAAWQPAVASPEHVAAEKTITPAPVTPQPKAVDFVSAITPVATSAAEKPSAAGAAQAMGGWRDSTTKDAMTDVVTTGSTVSAAEGELHVDCDAGRATVAFYVKAYLGSYATREVDYRIDDGAAVKAAWVSDGRLAMVEGDNALTLARQLQGAKRFVIRAYDFENGSVTAEFDISGADVAVPHGLGACGS
jgi:uncharacterized protein